MGFPFFATLDIIDVVFFLVTFLILLIMFGLKPSEIENGIKAYGW